MENCIELSGIGGDHGKSRRLAWIVGWAVRRIGNLVEKCWVQHGKDSAALPWVRRIPQPDAIDADSLGARQVGDPFRPILSLVVHGDTTSGAYRIQRRRSCGRID